MTIDKVLIETTKKLITINSIADWKNELLSKAPPVLWFGNSKSEKKIVLTIGANPSRWEFLDKSVMKSCSIPYNKTCYEDKYLLKQRFYHLTTRQSYNDILLSKWLRDKIIDSYDKYFTNNPYNWFGSNKEDSYKVEGVLRSLGASYFEINSEFRACHIDIFPFPTISDFNKIQEVTQRDILDQLWAKNIVDQILNYFNPKFILIFGRTNFNYFSKYFNLNVSNGTKWQANKSKGKCEYWHTSYGNFKIIGVSVNLGNPKGFDAAGLKELGTELNNIISL